MPGMLAALAGSSAGSAGAERSEPMWREVPKKGAKAKKGAVANTWYAASVVPHGASTGTHSTGSGMS
jgi:hypothetical protein